MRRHLTSMTAGLAIGITVAVAGACAAGAYLYSKHHLRELLDAERATALAQGELMRAALEHQMIENDRSLIADMIASFGREPRLSNVLLLDRTGAVKYSSARVTAPGELELGSPTCQACHRHPPSQRETSRIVETGAGTMLRTVIPFPNRPACHGCHDPAHRINGIMMLDYDVGALRAATNRDLRVMVAGTGGLALLLIVLIAVIVRVAVLRRLQRFETTARQIAAGDLARRVPAEGSDTVSWLAREFNTMADSMTGLVGEVQLQRERLETVINSIDDGIVVLDPARTVIAANDAFLKRAERSRDDVLGCCCRDVAPGVCTASDCPTLACLKSGQRQVRICERHTPDGRIAWEEVHASPVLGPAGDLVQIVEVWRDISERRAAEARLAESHRLASLGLLASGFSHEMNTPLATVLMCVESIQRAVATAAQSGETEDIAESAAIARDQLLRCRGITQHFLRMSRGQPGPGDVVDLQAAVAAVARLIEPTARQHGARIEVDVPEGLHARADEAELQHALMNLLLNAIQACGGGGRVTVAAEGGEAVRLRVADTGCGIAPEHQTRVFEPFFSLRKGGTGLGLFLALNFVRGWGAEIALTSAPGAGSTFEIVFAPASGAQEFPAAS